MRAIASIRIFDQKSQNTAPLRMPLHKQRLPSQPVRISAQLRGLGLYARWRCTRCAGVGVSENWRGDYLKNRVSGWRQSDRKHRYF